MPGLTDAEMDLYYEILWRECDAPPTGTRDPHATDVWILPGFKLLTPDQLKALPLKADCFVIDCQAPADIPPPAPLPIPAAGWLFSAALLGVLVVGRKRK